MEDISIKVTEIMFAEMGEKIEFLKRGMLENRRSIEMQDEFVKELAIRVYFSESSDK